MLFSDDKRFQRPMAPISDKRIMAQIMRPETPSHVGPGTYFSLNSEDQRNGWAPKTFSRREPMSPPSPSPVIEMPPQNNSISTSPNKNDYNKSGTLFGNGLVSSPKGDYYKQSPGPGQYNIDMCTTSFPPSPGKSQGLSRVGTAEISRKSSSMGSSPKFAYITPHNQLRNEVLFQSNERNFANVGPGHYLLPTNQIVKKSHNLRSIPNIGNNQPNNNKYKNDKIPGIQKIVDIRLNLGTPGTSFRIPADMERPKTSGNIYDKKDNYSSNYFDNNKTKSKHKHTVIDLDELQK